MYKSTTEILHPQTSPPKALSAVETTQNMVVLACYLSVPWEATGCLGVRALQLACPYSL